MRHTALVTILAFLPVAALASTTETAQQQSSRALKIAKRVAENENLGDLPSRAVWLGQRVVKNAKTIAYEQKPASQQKSKKRSQDSQKN